MYLDMTLDTYLNKNYNNLCIIIISIIKYIWRVATMQIKKDNAEKVWTCGHDILVTVLLFLLSPQIMSDIHLSV